MVRVKKQDGHYGLVFMLLLFFGIVAIGKTDEVEKQFLMIDEGNGTIAAVPLHSFLQDEYGLAEDQAARAWVIEVKHTTADFRDPKCKAIIRYKYLIFPDDPEGKKLPDNGSYETSCEVRKIISAVDAQLAKDEYKKIGTTAPMVAAELIVKDGFVRPISKKTAAAVDDMFKENPQAAAGQAGAPFGQGDKRPSAAGDVVDQGLVQPLVKEVGSRTQELLTADRDKKFDPIEAARRAAIKQQDDKLYARRPPEHNPVPVDEVIMPIVGAGAGLAGALIEGHEEGHTSPGKAIGYTLLGAATVGFGYWMLKKVLRAADEPLAPPRK